MTTAETFWDARATEFDSRSDEIDQVQRELTLAAIRYLQPDDTMLDYACGTGNYSLPLAMQVKEIHAIDISSKMIAIAREKAEECHINNVTFTQAVIFDDHLKPESFDVVTAFNILHLLEDGSKAVKRIHDLLKPGGTFISATPSLGEGFGLKILFFRLLSKTGVVPNLKSVSFAHLDNWLTDAGFSLIEQRAIKQTPPEYFLVGKKQ